MAAAGSGDGHEKRGGRQIPSLIRIGGLNQIGGQLDNAQIQDQPQGQKNHVFVMVVFQGGVVSEKKQIGYQQQGERDQCDSDGGRVNGFDNGLFLQGIELDKPGLVDPFALPDDHFSGLNLVHDRFDGGLGCKNPFLGFVFVHENVGLEQALADIHNQVGQVVIDLLRRAFPRF